MATPPTTTSRSGERAISLIEVIIVLGIVAILGAVVAMGMSSRIGAREKVSMTRLQEAKTTMQRMRDREQMTLREIVGAGSYGACASLNPMPPVSQLSGGCKTAWDAVNTRLAPFVGSPQAAAELMTDGSTRPILVETREVGCPAATADRVVAVHPSGDPSKPTQQVLLDLSQYGC